MQCLDPVKFGSNLTAPNESKIFILNFFLTIYLIELVGYRLFYVFIYV